MSRGFILSGFRCRMGAHDLSRALVAFCGDGIARGSQGDEAPGVRIATELRDGVLHFGRYILVWGPDFGRDGFSLEVDDDDDFTFAVARGFAERFTRLNGGAVREMR